MRLLSLLAAAGLATLGTAAPAHPADRAEVTLSGPSAVHLRPFPETGEPRQTKLKVDTRNPGRAATGAYTLTVDFRGLGGIARVTGRPGDGCTATATTLVCERTGAQPGTAPAVDLRLTAVRGSRPGQSGDLTVTAHGPGARYRSLTTTVAVGGTDLRVIPFDLDATTAVGQRQQVPLAFENTGTEDAGELVLDLTTTRGLEFVERYDNCTYPDPRRPVREGSVRCHFTGPFEAKATYELDSPLTLLANRHALADTFSYVLTPDPEAETAAAGIRERTPLARKGSGRAGGKGKTLGLTAQRPRPAAPMTADLHPADNGQDFSFKTANSADFAAFGATLKGDRGSTAALRVALRNQGPAWIERADGEAFGAADIRIPQGARVTRKPQGCHARTAGGAPRTEQLGAPRYFCTGAARVFLDGAAVSYPFEVAVDRYVPDATGSITVGRSFATSGGTWRLKPADRNRANDTARIFLNPLSTPTPSPTPTRSPSPTPTASATATAGPTPTATASPTPGSTGSTGGTGGNLANTGSGGAGPLAALAGGAVLAGGVLVLVFRRRAARA
ncbi:hypothetical protein LG634_13715 [Streptomyces bambusae]|uniref:hypothetical protein n=1 Tax=Streptomyces bambusae TaxID=1550616 RepID=UPI001CFC70EB|nr:hypothetical protein [Streptomyces bambusae]MCB5165888.1 hypothetical protein [Streptomyces bambusae]